MVAIIIVYNKKFLMIDWAAHLFSQMLYITCKIFHFSDSTNRTEIGNNQGFWLVFIANKNTWLFITIGNMDWMICFHNCINSFVYK